MSTGIFIDVIPVFLNFLASTNTIDAVQDVAGYWTFIFIINFSLNLQNLYSILIFVAGTGLVGAVTTTVANVSNFEHFSSFPSVDIPAVC